MVKVILAKVMAAVADITAADTRKREIVFKLTFRAAHDIFSFQALGRFPSA